MRRDAAIRSDIASTHSSMNVASCIHLVSLVCSAGKTNQILSIPMDTTQEGVPSLSVGLVTCCCCCFKRLSPIPHHQQSQRDPTRHSAQEGVAGSQHGRPSERKILTPTEEAATTWLAPRLGPSYTPGVAWRGWERPCLSLSSPSARRDARF